MGRKKQPLKPGPPSQPLRAQGKGGRKRIPTSAFDPAAGAAIAPRSRTRGRSLLASPVSGQVDHLNSLRPTGFAPVRDVVVPARRKGGIQLLAVAACCMR